MLPRSAHAWTASFGGAVFLLACATPACAQVLPGQDAANVMQDHLRRIEKAAPPPVKELAPEPAAPRPVAPAAATLFIYEIQFSRSELLEAEELRALAQRYVGRVLGTADIQQLLDDLASLYRDKGILTAMPVLPRQDLRSGLMRILLVEGRLGKVKVEAPQSVDSQWVKRWFELEPGAVVRTDSLRERLLRFNTASDMAAQAQFVAGDEFGVSDLAIEVQKPDKVQGWAFYELMSGSISTNRSHLTGAGLRLAPASSQGGRLDAAAILTDASRTLTGSFGLPLGVGGWRAAVSATTSESRNDIAGLGSRARVQGTSSSASGDISRTWAMQSPWWFTSRLSIGRNQSVTRAFIDSDPVPVQEVQYARNKVTVTGTLQHESPTARGFVTSSLNSTPHRDSYSYWELAASWQQSLEDAPGWSWRTSGTLRAVPRGKISGLDLFYLGGSDTVRGFDPSSASGNEGGVVQLELRHNSGSSVWGQVESYAFMDSGFAKTDGAHRELQSAGFAVQTRFASGVGVDLVGTRQLSNPQRGRERLLVRLIYSW